ncbi:potassium transporter Kup [Cumulibacter manganitolerans]|uniref:potassium transporter Kup n=1 Tax=Cumulibacter manganitolerans TaxID=1884992 RepID=UPI001295B72E|nr:potassium transporter Kup [Cumulibacter manganitolerans]
MTSARRPGPALLALTALGVVYGDIGTSPLYAIQVVFSIDHGLVQLNRADVYGSISLMFWSIVMVVCVKYLGFITRADNDGEGGILALAHLTRQGLRPGSRRYGLVMILGVIGAALFYGDSLLTPSISVLSAVEGIEVALPSLSHVVLAIGVVIIVALFAVQHLGTEKVGRSFGPIMVVWFVTLAALGIGQIAAHPSILGALSPHHAVLFILDHPLISFVASGAIVLVITGTEALYADMGHFGRPAITTAWFGVVFPALTLNYLGQGAMILNHPETVGNPFFQMAPAWGRIPLVVLSTAATVIASQAVISGVYSVSRQAERLGYLPRLTVRQTSAHTGGQIYVPAVNWLVFGGVLALMLTFRESSRLATAYGVAVTATFLLTTALFCVYAASALGWKRWQVVLAGGVFGLIELAFFSANVTKVLHGGWLPILVALVLTTVMLTWRRGVVLVTARRRKLEGPLVEYLGSDDVVNVTRVPGSAVFLHPSKETVPLALRENVQFNQVLHENDVIVTTRSLNVPHVEDSDRVTIDHLASEYDRITHVQLDYGFSDAQDVPAGLAVAVERHGVALNLATATYFISRINLRISNRPGMVRWRKRIVQGLAQNAARPSDYFHLPIDRTVLMGAEVNF